jgi:L-amino acid N-acyltransferase YncA
MTTSELLKAFLQLPDLCTVGSAQERAAFTAIYIDGRSVREAAEGIGVSKSQVSNLAAMFQTKLASRVRSLRVPISREYRELYLALHDRLGKLQEWQSRR